MTQPIKAIDELAAKADSLRNWSEDYDDYEIMLVLYSDAERIITAQEQQLSALEAKLKRYHETQDRDYLCLNHVVGGMNEDVDCIACFEKQQQEQRIGELETRLALQGDPWPIRDAVVVLMRGVEHLHEAHHCDADGIEERQAAWNAAKKWLAALGEPMTHQPITDITSAVAVLNERGWRGANDWFSDRGAYAICADPDVVYPLDDAIAIANSLVMGERIAELEAQLAKVPPPSSAADCEPPRET